MGALMLIDAVREGDWEAIGQIELEAGVSRWGERALRQEASRPGVVFLVAREGGEVCGFIVGRVVADEVEVLNFAVGGRWRQRGVGHALFSALLGRAAERGARQVVLEVRASNTAARRLYERFGLKVVGRRRDYYSGPIEDALLMWGSVSPFQPLKK